MFQELTRKLWGDGIDTTGFTLSFVDLSDAHINTKTVQILKQTMEIIVHQYIPQKINENHVSWHM